MVYVGLPFLKELEILDLLVKKIAINFNIDPFPIS